MDGADRAMMVSLGRTPDPLLEEVIAAEGYEIVHAGSVGEALSRENAESYSAVAVLVGEDAAAESAAFLREAAGRMPSARFIVATLDGYEKPDADGLHPSLSERLLWLDGDTCGSENVDRIRRFLRGEGYNWASELEAELEGTSILDTAAHFGEGKPAGLRNVRRFAGDLSRFTELRPMLQEALNRYLAILKCGAGSIYLWDEGSETLVLEAAVGPEEERRIGLRQKLGEGLAGWVAKVGEPILVTDSRKVHKLRGRACRRYSNFSCISLPVTHGGQLFGVVCLTMPQQNKAFEPEDLRLAQNLSEKLASAIRPLNVLSELRRFSERLLGAFKSSSEMVLEKDAEVEALRDLSRNILDNVPLAVIAYDRELRVRSSNLAARQLFGAQLSRPTARGAAPLEEGIDMGLDLWRSKLRGVVVNERKFRLQRVGYRSEGRQRMLDIHCSPLCTPEGETTVGILTVQDMTEDVEMEHKLQSAERLAIVGKIAAKVAHELNNPLDGILRFLSLAVRQIDKPEQAKEYLKQSRQGLLRMSHILTELLAFSRSHYATHRPVSMSQLIHQGLAPYEHRAREADIRIELDVPSDLPSCPSNEVWEVFGNVVKNALDAMGESGVLRIRAAANEKNVTIVVSDTGPGVPSDLRSKIFEPFFTTKEEGEGTGLGLAVCRDSLRKLGGDIHLLPSERGAVFEITVPVNPQTE